MHWRCFSKSERSRVQTLATLEIDTRAGRTFVDGLTSYRGVAVAGLPLAVVFAWIGRGQLVHLTLVGSAFVLIAVPCALLAVLTSLVSRKPDLVKMRRLVVALAILIAVQLVSVPIGVYLRRSDVRDARAFCDGLALALERESKAEGMYPVTLGSRLGAANRVPYLLRNESIYVSDGRSFVLSFTERNAVVPRTHLYSSDLKAWITF
jgi:hypothetical protein